MIRPRPLLSLLLFGSGFLLETADLRGGCIEHGSEAHAFDGARSAAEVEVLSSRPYRTTDGSIRTQTSLRVIEQFKGDAPDRFEINSPGGTLRGRREFRSDSLDLTPGKSYILYLNRSIDGTWTADPHHAYRAPRLGRATGDFFRGRARGPKPDLIPASAPETASAQENAGVPGSVVTPTGYQEDNGQPTRFTSCDGDLPIPYLIDLDESKLPAGMNAAGAVAAVAESFNAWAASSSLKFRYEGTLSLGTAASLVNVSDRRLRIQLHDNFNVINNASGTLGIGGGSFQVASSTFTGGRVGSQGFQERLYGYVVLESTTNASFMQNTANFKRVLTHEIGHALGLGHSSNNASEPNAILKAATMYFTASANSAGATIQAYDVDRIQFGYPVTNTPPYVTDRLIPVVTAPNPSQIPTGIPGLNRIRLRATDRQGGALTAIITNGDSEFSLSGNHLIFTPTGYFGEDRLTDSEIEANTTFAKANVQFSDGVNLSRAAYCSVIGFFPDTTPSDGLPNDWMTTHFGSTAVGAAGSNHHPDSDPDKDGLTNRVEFYLNTNPNLASSGPVKPVYDRAARRVSFTPVRFAPYWIESSATLAGNSWALRRVATLYQATGVLAADFGTDPLLAKEFYRVGTGP